MKLSDRASQIETSPIRKLIPYEKNALNKGIKVHRLNIGEPNIDINDIIVDTNIDFRDHVVKYESSSGNYKLVNLITEYYKKYEILIDIDDVFITNGGSESLLFAMLSTCNVGDNIIVFEPYYANYNNIATLNGIDLNPITTTMDNNFHLPKKDKIISKINNNTKAILITNPGNPTGCVYTKEEIIMLCEIASEYNLWIIADEVYREYIYDGRQEISLLMFKDFSQRVIIIDSISKRYGACGARIGCIISKNKELNKQILKLCQSRLAVATVEQNIACRLYESNYNNIKKIIKRFEYKRNLMYEQLCNIKGVKCTLPEGAFYIIVKLPVKSAEKFCIWLLNEFNINGSTIMLCPAKSFYKSDILGINEVRIAYTLNEIELLESVEILKKAIYIYSKKENRYE